jgi:MYXO-CTERM domain-containing protein
VPGNVPALRFSGLFKSDVVDLELVTDAGGAIETRIERGTGYAEIVPAQPLAAGGYVARYREVCSGPLGPAPDGGGDAGSPTRELPFGAGPAAELPSSLGDVTLVPVHIVDDPMSFIGRTSIAEFVVAPSAELAPFLPVSRFEVRLNDTTFVESVTRPGALEAAGGKVVVRSICGGAISSCNDYARQGSYTATVAAVIPGSEQALVSAPFDVDLTCADAVEIRNGSCNCSVGRATSQSGCWALVAVVAAARSSRRRKRCADAPP